MKLQVFCFDLPHSDACFIKAYGPAHRGRLPVEGKCDAMG
jgi:hypothetical protein